MSDDKVEIARLTERIGAIDAKASKAHERIDNQDTLLRNEISALQRMILEFRDWMNQTKGRDKVLLFSVGIGGSVLGSVLSATIIYVILKK